MRKRVSAQPRSKRKSTLVTVSAVAEELMRLIGQYRAPDSANRAFELSWSPSSSNTGIWYPQRSGMLFADSPATCCIPQRPAARDRQRLRRNALTQSNRWAYAISWTAVLGRLCRFAGSFPGSRLLLAHLAGAATASTATWLFLNREPQVHDHLSSTLLAWCAAHQQTSWHTTRRSLGKWFVRAEDRSIRDT